jgi:hypothetical protein
MFNVSPHVIDKITPKRHISQLQHKQLELEMAKVEQMQETFHSMYELFGIAAGEELSLLLQRFPTVQTIPRARLQLSADFFISELGLSKQAVARMILKWPSLITTTVDTHRSKIKALQGFGISETRLIRMLPIRSGLLGFNEKALQSKLDLLRSLVELPHGSTARLVGEGGLAAVSTDRLNNRVAYMLSLGLSRTELGKLIARHPSFLKSSDQNIEHKVNFLRELGASTDMIPRMFVALSPLLTISVEQNLRPRVEFVKTELNAPTSNFADWMRRNSALFCCSLEGRIKPRLAFAKSIVGAGDLTDQQKWDIATGTDAMFAKRFGTSELKYHTFLQHYRQKHPLLPSVSRRNVKPTSKPVEQPSTTSGSTSSSTSSSNSN